MEDWNDDDIVVPTGRLSLQHESDFSSSNSNSALFSDDRPPTTDTEEDDDWAKDFEARATAVASGPVEDLSFDEEKGGTIKALPPMLLAADERVKLLGTTASSNVGDDWHGDLEPPHTGAFRTIRPQGSFASHISDASDDARFSTLPRGTDLARSSVSSKSSHVEAGDEADFEADFELPLAPLALSANRHARQLSSASSSSQQSFAGPSRPFAPPQRPPISRTQTVQAPSRSTQSGSDNDWVERDGGDFFADLDVPDIFEQRPAQKVDLKAVLQAKLSARLELDDPKHQRHVESPTDAHDDGLVIGEDSEWSGKLAAGGTPRTSRISRIPRTGSPRHSAPLSQQVRSRALPSPARSTFSSSAGSPPSSPPMQSRQPPVRRTVVVSPTPPHSGGSTQSAPVSSRTRIATGTLRAREMPPPAVPVPTRTSTLRHKKSTPHLQATQTVPPPLPGLSRKRSMPALADLRPSLGRAASGPIPPVPSTPSPTSSFAAPTISSRARTISAQTPLSAIAGSPSLRSLAADSGAPRVTLPTLAATRARHLPTASDPTGRTSHALGVRAAATQVVSRPKRPRTYGDGTELDAIDDLPVNKELERKFTAEPIVVRRGSLTRPDLTRRVVSRQAEASARRKKPDGKPRAQPHLIRALGTMPASRNENGMRWNEEAKRWEGNEAALRAFDNAVQTSTRPALITNYGPRSPTLSTATYSSPASSMGSAGLGVTTGAGGSRRLGDMVFDPVKMCWINTAPDAEDEIDFGDDEADRMIVDHEAGRLKPKTSFFSESGGSRPGSTRGVPATPAERAFWTECLEAERRHAEEMRPWSGQRLLLNAQDPHAYLYDIARIVKGS